MIADSIQQVRRTPYRAIALVLLLLVSSSCATEDPPQLAGEFTVQDAEILDSEYGVLAELLTVDTSGAAVLGSGASGDAIGSISLFLPGDFPMSSLTDGQIVDERVPIEAGRHGKVLHSEGNFMGVLDVGAKHMVAWVDVDGDGTVDVASGILDGNEEVLFATEGAGVAFLEKWIDPDYHDPLCGLPGPAMPARIAGASVDLCPMSPDELSLLRFDDQTMEVFLTQSSGDPLLYKSLPLWERVWIQTQLQAAKVAGWAKGLGVKAMERGRSAWPLAKKVVASSPTGRFVTAFSTSTAKGAANKVTWNSARIGDSAKAAGASAKTVTTLRKVTIWGVVTTLIGSGGRDGEVKAPCEQGWCPSAGGSCGPVVEAECEIEIGGEIYRYHSEQQWLDDAIYSLKVQKLTEQQTEMQPTNTETNTQRIQRCMQQTEGSTDDGAHYECMGAHGSAKVARCTQQTEGSTDDGAYYECMGAHGSAKVARCTQQTEGSTDDGAYYECMGAHGSAKVARCTQQTEGSTDDGAYNECMRR